MKLTMPVSETRDHAQGPTNASVILLEYVYYNARIVPRPILP